MTNGICSFIHVAYFNLSFIYLFIYIFFSLKRCNCLWTGGNEASTNNSALSLSIVLLFDDWCSWEQEEQNMALVTNYLHKHLQTISPFIALPLKVN